MLHNSTVYKKAAARYSKDCDIVKVMENVRQSNNFMKNFLTREQKLLLKFDMNNIIDGESSSGTEGGPSDIDEIISTNLSSSNGLIAMFTLLKVKTLLKPYTL